MTAKAEHDPRLVPIERPNGKLYRPRMIAGYPVADDEELVSGICVLGTHDLAVAQPLADECVYKWIESGYTAADPETGWFREGYASGQPMWVRDPVKGRAGIMFHGIAEIPVEYVHIEDGTPEAGHGAGV